MEVFGMQTAVLGNVVIPVICLGLINNNNILVIQEEGRNPVFRAPLNTLLDCLIIDFRTLITKQSCCKFQMELFGRSLNASDCQAGVPVHY